MSLKKINQEKLWNVLLINLPITLVLCLFAQLLSVLEGKVAGFSVGQFLLNLPVAYLAATVIGLALPSVPWGMRFAARCGAKPESLSYALLVNVVVNTVYTLLLSVIMTFVNVSLLAHSPLIAVVFGILTNFIPLWFACYLVSFFSAPPCRKLASRLAGTRT